MQVQNMKIKPDILLCSINHKGSVSIPGGQSVIRSGDMVIVVTTNTRLNDIKDILK